LLRFARNDNMYSQWVWGLTEKLVLLLQILGSWMKLSDEVIIQRCLEGDGDAFSLLVERYQNAVYGLCYHMVGNFADSNSPVKYAEAEELRLSITEAIATLSEKNRFAVTLYYIDGLSYGEIGDFLGASSSAVKSRLHRARKELKEELITMVEDKFDEHQLPEDFSEKVIQEMAVSQMLMEPENKFPVVILQNKADEEQVLPIFIGMFEAMAICSAMEGTTKPMRPMTHDLMANMLEELGAKVVRIVVTDLKESTFYARIVIQINGALKEIDARPSDSIALALRTGVPIFVAKSILGEGAASSLDYFLKSMRLEPFNPGFMPTLSMMFQIDSKFQEDLSNGNISDELRQEIENNGIALSQDAKVSQKSVNSWQINDGYDEYFVLKIAENKLDFCSAMDSSKEEEKE